MGTMTASTYSRRLILSSHPRRSSGIVLVAVGALFVVGGIISGALQYPAGSDLTKGGITSGVAALVLIVGLLLLRPRRDR